MTAMSPAGQAEGARADFCIAFEGGIEEDAHGRQVCFAIATRLEFSRAWNDAGTKDNCERTPWSCSLRCMLLRM